MQTRFHRIDEYLEVIDQCLFGSGCVSSLPSIVQTKPDADLVVEDERPDQTENELQVGSYDVSTS